VYSSSYFARIIRFGWYAPIIRYVYTLSNILRYACLSNVFIQFIVSN
jgi:hypothetical protein